MADSLFRRTAQSQGKFRLQYVALRAMLLPMFLPMFLVALLPLLLSCGSSGGAAFQDEGHPQVYFDTRHERMLDTVIEQPGRVRRFLAMQQQVRADQDRDAYERVQAAQARYEESLRKAKADYGALFDEMQARVRAAQAERKRQRMGDQGLYSEMQARQRAIEEARNRRDEMGREEYYAMLARQHGYAQQEELRKQGDRERWIEIQLDIIAYEEQQRREREQRWAQFTVR